MFADAETADLSCETRQEAQGLPSSWKHQPPTTSWQGFVSVCGKKTKRDNRRRRRPSALTQLDRQEELGRGGLGIVYKFKDRNLNRLVALKVARKECLDSDDRLRRFVQEYSITAKLQHPAVPPVYAIGQLEDGRPYYVMRLVRGSTLAERIERFQSNGYHRFKRTNTEFDEILSAFFVVCDAMHHAHMSNIIHRDIKPSNIIVEDSGAAFVIDWGLARSRDTVDRESGVASEQSAHTLDNQRLGTPAWMSPEQARGDVAVHNSATDVYCLGATLFHILCGLPPHIDAARLRLSNAEDDSWVRLIVDNPTPIRALQTANVPAELISICQKAMATDQNDRYDSAAALAADLRGWTRHHTVLAHEGRYSKGELLGRWASRHSRVLATSLLSLAVVAIVSLLAAVGIAEAANSESAALERETVANTAMFNAFEDMTSTTLEEDVLRHPELQPYRVAVLAQIEEQYTQWASTESSRASEVSRAARGLALIARITKTRRSQPRPPTL